MVIFITPRVIEDQFDARDSTVDARDSLEELISDQSFGSAREDVLRSEKIDAVTEEYLGEIELPTTTIPPKKALLEESLGGDANHKVRRPVLLVLPRPHRQWCWGVRQVV